MHETRPRKAVWAELVLATRRNPETRTPVQGAPFPKNHDGERTPTEPHPTLPAARADRSPIRVNIANWAGFRAGCVIYAQRNTNAARQKQLQTYDGPRRDGNPKARA